MKTQSIRVKLRDGEMGAHLAIPDKTPVGAIIAIMEIWGVNDTMRRHAHEFAEIVGQGLRLSAQFRHDGAEQHRILGDQPLRRLDADARAGLGKARIVLAP